MRPCWAAFAVYSLEMARSAAAPKPLSCGTRTKVRLLVLFIRTLEASCRGLGMQWRTPQVRRCWESVLSFFSQAGGQSWVCVSQPLPDRDEGFFVIYIGGLHE